MSTDIPLARREVIAQRLADGQTVVSATLATEFDVSEDAIRRDLRALAGEGRCKRVYGGALPIAPGASPMAARVDEARERKAALAQAAAATIRPSEFIFLDSSSTNLALVDYLPDDHALKVATNSIDIAAAVLRRGDLQLIMVGGTVDATVGGCIDAGALQAIADMHIDRCFLGACAIGLKSGIAAFHHADALFKRTLLSVSQISMALVTTEKLEAKAPHRVAALKALDTLVLENDVPAKTLAALRGAGLSLLQAL